MGGGTETATEFALSKSVKMLTQALQTPEQQRSSLNTSVLESLHLEELAWSKVSVKVAEANSGQLARGTSSAMCQKKK